MSMQGALRYDCACGAQFLVAINPGRDAAWHDALLATANALGAVQLVDGAQARFACGGCGRVHARSETGAVKFADAGPA